MDKDTNSQGSDNSSSLVITIPRDGTSSSISTSICPVCKGNVKVANATLCPKCSTPYHSSCALKYSTNPDGGFKKCCGPPSPLPTTTTLSSTPSSHDDLRMLIREEMQLVRETFSSEFRSLNTTISNLSTEIKAVNAKIDACASESHDTVLRVNALEDKVEEIIEGNSSPNNNFDSCLTEVEDRLRRRNNLIIYGLTDHDPSIFPNFHDTDLELTKSLFASCIKNSSFDNIKIWRIGKFSTIQTKHRPLKVIFSNDTVPSQIRTAFVTLKKSAHLPPEFAELSIAPDRTRNQQTEYQRAKQELIARIAQGEKNLKIAYRLGFPTIITT